MRPAQSPPPPRTARLFGRSRALDEVRSALGRGAVVTLVGPPGIGKSELALHLLATAENDDHVFVDLLSARDEDDIVAAIAAALDVRVCESPLLAVRTALIARGGLLVLDRCQHLPAIAEVVRALRVENQPSILCTSLAPIGVPDERAIVVDPIEPFEAVELFAVRSGRPLESSRDRGFVRDLTVVCGGLPHAIELCAAWDDSPLALLRELEVRVLRDRELGDVVTWSIERLDRVSRVALSRASTIEGSFHLAAFEAIAELPADVAPTDVLSLLATRALIARSPRGDASFAIAPIVRRIAEALLSDGERTRTLQRHATYFAANAAVDIVERSRERADLLAAHQTALVDPELSDVARALARSLAPVLRRHGPRALAHGVVEATLTLGDDPILAVERFALDASRRAPSTKDPRVAMLAGEVLLDRDDPRGAAALFSLAVRDPAHAAGALRGLAEAQRRLGALDDAAATVERAIARDRDVGDLLTLRGRIALDAGELQTARSDLVEALTILGEGRDERACAAATIALAAVQAEEGLDPTTTLESAADLARRAGDLSAMARVEKERAVNALVNGELATALAHLDESERLRSTPLVASLREAIRARGDQRDDAQSSLGRAHLDRARVRLALVRRENAPKVPDYTGARAERRTLWPAKCAVAVDGGRAFLDDVELHLEKRATLKQVLAQLLRARIEEPGRAVAASELFAAGWPGERIPVAAQSDRVRAALQALRDLGMRGHIVTLAGGWALQPDRAYDVLPT